MRGDAVDVVDDLSSGSLGNLAAARAAASGALKFHHLDVRADELDELFARRQPDVVVHLAALPRSVPDRVVGNVAIGYSDGYWDSGHTWHTWAQPAHRDAYRAAKGAVTAAMRNEPSLATVRQAAAAVANPFYTPKAR